MHLGSTGPDAPAIPMAATPSRMEPVWNVAKAAMGVALLPMRAACSLIKLEDPPDSNTASQQDVEAYIQRRDTPLQNICFGDRDVWIDFRPLIVGGIFSLAVWYGVYKLVSKKS